MPENAQDEWIDKHKQTILHYINFIGNENKDFPGFRISIETPFSRKIGTGDEQSDAEFVNVVSNAKFEDYNLLFRRINDLFFTKVREAAFSSDTPAIQLRNVVLKHLKNALANVSNFAEDTEIKEEQFFYRECMKQLFDPKKFLIQGYKGTGKTYLYKALTDKGIASNIQRWADKDQKDTIVPVFVNILPADESALVFADIRYSSIDEPEYYFNAFWQVYTWNTLLLCPEFVSIREQSELCDYVKPLTGAIYAKEALVRINELIEKGVSTLISIEKDILKINELLQSSGKRLLFYTIDLIRV